MAVSFDFYALLEIPRDADEATISDAHRAKVKHWTGRTASHDLSRRQEAETWMSRLKEARRILLDPQQRAAYDRELDSEGVARPAAASSSTGDTQDWVAAAEGALGRGDYHAAAYAAREATHTIGNSAKSWMLRSRANAGLENLQDALYEAKQATMIAANDPECHFQLGMVQEELGQFSDSLTSYRTAMQLDASSPQYMVAVANVLAGHGQLEAALTLVKDSLKRFPGNSIVHDYYALLLVQQAESVPAHSGRGKYMVTTKREIAEMRPLLDEARSYAKDPDTIKHIDDIGAYLDKAEASRFSVPGDGLIQQALTVLSPVIVLIIGGILDLMVPAFLIAIVAGFVVYKICWVPGWKVNDRDILGKAHLGGYI